MSCEQWAHHDAPYVLGTLPAAERREFEHHLETCDSCARSVRELAGLPGLLSRLDAAEVAGLDPVEPVPPSVLPALLAAADRQRKRRRLWAVAAGAAGAAVLVLGTVAATGGLDDPRQDGPSTPGVAGAPLDVDAMTPVDQDRLTADIGFREVAWGTKLQLRCRYLGTPESVAALPAYALVLRTRDGDVERVATWKAVAGKVATIDAATATSADEIASVAVESVSGRVLLHLDR